VTGSAGTCDVGEGSTPSKPIAVSFLRCWHSCLPQQTIRLSSLLHMKGKPARQHCLLQDQTHLARSCTRLMAHGPGLISSSCDPDVRLVQP
jgi:hypothetical protein